MKVPTWPICVGAILVVNFIGVAIVLHFALKDPSVAIEPGYYEQALAWDEHREQQQANVRLAWGSAIEHGAAGEDPTVRVFTLSLTDKDDVAIDGAVVEYVAFNAARAKERVSGSFTEVGDGRYDAVLTIDHPGMWVFRLRCERGVDTFTTQSHLRVMPSASGR